MWDSSTTRNDTGGEAREGIWVQTFERDETTTFDRGSRP